MGFVWNVMLSYDGEEHTDSGQDEAREACIPLERINAWLPYGQLVSLIGATYVDEVGSGLDANLYGGGFEHFDIEGFIEMVKAQDWKARSKVQLWVKGAEEGMGAEPFTLIKLGGRRGKAPVQSVGSRKQRATGTKPANKRKAADRLAKQA